jgi:hypothetical protein
MVFLFLTFWEAAILFSITLVLIYIPKKSVNVFLLPHFQQLLSLAFNKKDILTEVRWHNNNLIFISVLIVQDNGFLWHFHTMHIMHFYLIHLPSPSSSLAPHPPPLGFFPQNSPPLWCRCLCFLVCYLYICPPPDLGENCFQFSYLEKVLHM